MKRGILAAAALLIIMQIQGEIAFEGNVQSEVLGSNRFVRIYLPPGYHERTEQRFPVLYLQDGQNVFSTAGAHAAFGWGSWELDLTADRLIREGKMLEVILVGIDCSAQRYREYRGPAGARANNAAYENYARFLTGELKPKIDREYRTLPGAGDTGLMGSSMGGICSLALAWDQPNIFGKAASLSGAFQVERKYFLRQILGRHSAGPKPLKLYLDSGVTDYSGGDDGAADTRQVAEELKRIGWKEGGNLLHVVDQPLSAEHLQPFKLPPDKFEEAQRSQHNELYWRLRAEKALQFLFPPVEPK